MPHMKYVFRLICFYALLVIIIITAHKQYCWAGNYDCYVKNWNYSFSIETGAYTRCTVTHYAPYMYYCPVVGVYNTYEEAEAAMNAFSCPECDTGSATCGGYNSNIIESNMRFCFRECVPSGCNGCSGLPTTSYVFVYPYGATECECSDVEIKADRTSIAPGDTLKLTTVSDPPDYEYDWEIIPLGKGVSAKITPRGRSATIYDTQGEGYVIVNATGNQCADMEIIHIGCDSCSTCSIAGGGEADMGSVNVRIGTGKTANGRSSGSIYLRADTTSPGLATPSALEFSSLTGDVETIYVSDDLRQIVAPQTFVDIVTISAYEYEIRFYYPEAQGDLVSGVYEVVTGSTPFVTWTIENPAASSTDYDTLTLTEDRNGSTKTYEYEWDDTQSTWSLSKGTDQVHTKKVEIISGNLVETDTIKDGSNNTASKIKTTYKEITCTGQDPVERIIEKKVDPDGAALTITTTYYEEPSCPTGSCGQVASVLNPDGSWVWYAYDSDGRKTTEIRSWLDTSMPADYATAIAGASSYHVIYYDYTLQDASDSDDAQDVFRPRKVTEVTLGYTVSKTFYVYQVNGTTGERTEIVEQCTDPAAVYGATGNLKTTRVEYPFTGAALAYDGKIKEITFPDGRKDTYTYEYGIYTENTNPALPGTFAAGSGTDIREIITHGTSASPDGITNKTTRGISIQNDTGSELLQETDVYTGSSSYSQIQWTVRQYDTLGRPTHIYGSDGTHSEQSWTCCGLEYEVDPNGIQTDYTSYDSLNRVLTRVKEGAGTYPNITTTYTYDGVGRRLSETMTASSLSLSTSRSYDIAGRIDDSTDQAGLVTNYTYSDAVTTTVTAPGGATETTTRYKDGRTKSITGTGVISRYYEYGVNTDGTRWTKVYNGPSGTSSPMWEKTTTDLLGRTKYIEKPAYSGSTETIEYVYNNLGQLAKVISPGMADTLYTYDAMGNQTMSGLDVDDNGTLVLASTDRITQTDTSFVNDSTDWWQETTQTVYATDNDSTPVTTGSQAVRLTGLGTAETEGTLVGETISTDINGNETTSNVYIDRTAKTQTRIIEYPDATINAESVAVNGLVMSSTSKTGVETTFGYDALGRRLTVTDPRTGTTTTHYNTLGQVDYIDDPATNRTNYTYESTTGRKSTEENPLNKFTRYKYNDMGQVTHIWGDAATPVKYEYDNYGRLYKMYTYRSGTNWNATTWPGDSETPDITTWHYQESTGLLTGKEDAATSTVAYTYTTGNKLYTRTWARSSGSIVTTYTYNTNTGELTGIDYSDTTPDVTFTYDRLGRQKTVTDALGSRTFNYNTALQLDNEAMTGLYSKTITRTYDTTNIIGRNTGLAIGTEYSVTYGYESNTGRFNTVSWNIGTTSDTATYTYVTDSDLINQLSTVNGKLSTYSYETNRNLLTDIKNKYNNEMISRYHYIYDATGKRTSVKNSGAAFSGWLTGAQPDTQIPEQARHYEYDPIGNREAATGWDSTVEAATDITYTPNIVNQYTQISTDNGQQTTNEYPSYDEDGNLTVIPATAGIQPGGGQMVLGYNAENRLISVEPITPTEGDKKVEFIYDYIGRRIKKSVSEYQTGNWQLLTVNCFVYDGWNLIEELDGTGTTQKSYVWGLDLSQSLQGAGGVGGLLASVDSSANTYYYCYDGNGNVGQMVDASDGSIAAHYEYDPFGNTVHSTGTLASDNPFRFSTKYHDDESELYYYGRRYYSPELGRWINRDPIEEKGGLNLYGFVGNNPINGYDLLGLYRYKFLLWGWSGGRDDEVKNAFDNLKNNKMSKLYDEYESAYKAVNTLPDNCIIKEDMLKDLERLKNVLDKIKKGLEGDRTLYLTTTNKEGIIARNAYDPETGESYPWFIFGRNEGGFFSTDQDSATQSLFHELSHFEGKTEHGGTLWFDNAYNYDRLYNGEWKGMFQSHHRGAKSQQIKEEKCCPRIF